MIYKKYITCLLLVAALIGLIVYSPHYLTYSEPPVDSDAVILLRGQDYAARQKEARKLILEGYSSFLIVPAGWKILKVSENKGLTPFKKLIVNQNNPFREPQVKKEYQFYEDTHREILRAKAIMVNMGFKSATFVSSPYHMRRIKIIVGWVFKGEKYNFSFIPSRYEKTNSEFWIFHTFDLKWVLSEYLKIAWFFVYMPFTR